MGDGYRESAGSWADLERDCQRHGTRAPVLAVGDGGLAFRKALQETYNAEDRARLAPSATSPLSTGSTCAPRIPPKVTKGTGSTAAALATVFKLVESAPQRWRAVNAPLLVPLVRAGACFERGRLVERGEVTAG